MCNLLFDHCIFDCGSSLDIDIKNEDTYCYQYCRVFQRVEDGILIFVKDSDLDVFLKSCPFDLYEVKQISFNVDSAIFDRESVLKKELIP